MKHLITTSDNGLIFVWKLPEKIAQCLQNIKNEGQRIVEINERVPSIIEEVEEKDELGDSAGPKPIKAIKAASASNTEETKKEGEPQDEEDFDFEVPDKLKI